MAVHALELERDVRERLRDAVVELAGDAGPLGLGAERAEAAEPAGVVDREREQARQALDEVAAARGRTRSGTTSSSAISPTSAPRARSAVYRPLRASAANPPSSGWTSRSSIRIGCALVSARWSGCGQVVVGQVRREPDAFGELDGPHRLRVVAHEHHERAEPHDRPQPERASSRRPRGGRTTPGGSAASACSETRSSLAVAISAAWSIAAAWWLSISAIRLRVNAPSAPHSRNTTAIWPAERWSVASIDCITIVAAGRDHAGDRGADRRPAGPTRSRRAAAR